MKTIYSWEFKNWRINLVSENPEKRQFWENGLRVLLKSSVVSILFALNLTKKLRRQFRPVNIFYCPVKKSVQLVNCFLTKRLNLAFRALCSNGQKTGKIKCSNAWLCYFCSNYYAQKDRYDFHIKSCSGYPGYVYNFSTQSLLTFEENLKYKGDMPPVAYIGFETTAPSDTSLNPENRNLYAVSYVIIFAFHPDFRIKCVIIERSFGHSLQQLNNLNYLTHKRLTFITTEQIQQFKDCAFSVYVKKIRLRFPKCSAAN